MRSPLEKTRYETSLGLLTKKFIGLLRSAPDGVLDLNKASEYGWILCTCFRVTVQKLFEFRKLSFAVGHCRLPYRQWPMRVGHCRLPYRQWPMRVGHCRLPYRQWPMRVGHCRLPYRQWPMSSEN